MHRGAGILVAATAIATLSLVSPAVAAPAATSTSTTSRASNVSSRLGPVKHVSANGLNIGYRTGGRGTWLIMVMGRSGTMADWDPLLVRQLTRRNHVVVFDNRGMGTTNDDAVPSTDVTIPLMAQDTLDFASALGINRFDLMGWSMGGEISQQVTVDAPTPRPQTGPLRHWFRRADRNGAEPIGREGHVRTESTDCPAAQTELPLDANRQEGSGCLRGTRSCPGQNRSPPIGQLLDNCIRFGRPATRGAHSGHRPPEDQQQVARARHACACHVGQRTM